MRSPFNRMGSSLYEGLTLGLARVGFPPRFSRRPLFWGMARGWFGRALSKLQAPTTLPRKSDGDAILTRGRAPPPLRTALRVLHVCENYCVIDKVIGAMAAGSVYLPIALLTRALMAALRSPDIRQQFSAYRREAPD